MRVSDIDKKRTVTQKVNIVFRFDLTSRTKVRRTFIDPMEESLKWGSVREDVGEFV